MAYAEQNGTLSWHNLIDNATLSLGSWETAFPRNNVKERRLSTRAVSTDDAPASTKMLIDLGRLYPLSQICLLNTDADTACEYRIQADVDGTFSSPTYDSGQLPFFQSVYTSDELEFEDDNWFSLSYTEDELDREQRNLYAGFTQVYARYVLIQIFCEGAVSGKFSIGRVFIPKVVWQFEYNYEYNAGLTLESSTLVDRSLGGVAFFEERPQTKVFNFDLQWLTSREAYAYAYEVMRSQDVSGEVLFIPDKTDQTNIFRTAIYGRIRQLNPVTALRMGTYGTAFQIEGLR